MKNLMIASLALVATACGGKQDDSATLNVPSSPAPAAVSLVCRQPIADAGYTVKFYEQQGRIVRATLEEASFFTTTKLADYTTRRELRPRQVPDLPQKIFTFLDPSLADAGYNLSLTTGNIAGIQFAVVEQVTFTGTEVLATIACANVDGE